MLLQPKSFEQPDTFTCRSYGQRMPIFECMSRYVDANALKQADIPCFKCSQGEDVRLEYAKA